MSSGAGILSFFVAGTSVFLYFIFAGSSCDLVAHPNLPTPNKASLTAFIPRTSTATPRFCMTVVRWASVLTAVPLNDHVRTEARRTAAMQEPGIAVDLRGVKAVKDALFGVGK